MKSFMRNNSLTTAHSTVFFCFIVENQTFFSSIFGPSLGLLFVRHRRTNPWSLDSEVISERNRIFSINSPFVAFDVKIEIRGRDERLLTHETPIRFLTGVYSDMDFQIGRRQKSFAAKLAVIALQSLVIISVNVEV